MCKMEFLSKITHYFLECTHTHTHSVSKKREKKKTKKDEQILVSIFQRKNRLFQMNLGRNFKQAKLTQLVCHLIEDDTGTKMSLSVPGKSTGSCDPGHRVCRWKPPGLKQSSMFTRTKIQSRLASQSCELLMETWDAFGMFLGNSGLPFLAQFTTFESAAPTLGNKELFTWMF